MAIRIEGLSRTVRKLRLRTKRTNQACKIQLKDTAEELQELAQLMAPRKTGTLESAIKIDDDVIDKPFQLKMEVYIDGDIVTEGQEGGTDRNVSRYAEIMHDNLTPAGDLKLGKISMQKSDSVGVVVGGDFMTRALGEIQPDVIQTFKNVVKRALRF